MCGFVGFIGEPGALNGEALERLVASMAARLESRGPDDAGTWVSPAAGIALGHRRLAVIDLSAAGHQPMVSASGRSVIVYNGEVYNFAEIRRTLEAEGHRFRSGSDTEVVLEACVAWGVERAVSRFNGMFAFAFWDVHSRRLTLVRDRLGIKPLYWGRCGRVLFFGSQPKSFFDHPAWCPEVDRDALAAYLRYRYIPSPDSIFKGIEKLEPGTMIEIDENGTESHRRYWDPRSLARNAVRDRATLDDRTAVAALDELLRDAVKRRMVADVPLGVFLSGGIDSSTVAALTQAQSDRPIKSFTIGHCDERYDESHYAKPIAEHLGTDYTELHVSHDHACALLPKLASWYDEPFADSSQIPTYLVSEMAQRHVTVALSGDGGDELFAGYNYYHRAKWFETWPRPLRAALATLLRTTPLRRGAMSRVGRRFIKLPRDGDRVDQLATILSMADHDAIYRMLISRWDDPDALVRGGREPHGIVWDPTLRRDVPDSTERMMLMDLMTFLPDDILSKVDRASMATSLEVRVPLLDHRVVEFAWRLPLAMKVRDGRGKWLLRRVLSTYVPTRFTDRPKKGLGIPLDRWLRGPLRDWAEGLLSEDRLRESGYFEPAPIRKVWAEFLAGSGNHERRIWTILMFEAWRETWGIGNA